MNELVFEVTFLSDIVLPSSANTEGKIEKLTFIPGSNFLGMVAKKYDEFDESFNLFHSGKVRFGDALPVANGQLFYLMPRSFFHEKLNKEVLFNHHLIENFSQYTQLKQKRDNYISKSYLELEIKTNYAQKSAYDTNSRKSKDGSMYGYESIPEGTQWQFTVQYENGLSAQDIDKLKETLTGEQRLGKSKSAQYGRIRIENSEKAETVPCVDISHDEVFVYAKSRLALVDEEGNPTYDLRYLLEGLTDEQVVWEKCQIKSSAFAPYNVKMESKTYERVVINSGSVIVLRNVNTEQIESLKRGVGVYLAEGFGEVLLNPEFLMKKGGFSFTAGYEEKEDVKIAIKSDLGRFLQQKETEKYAESTVAGKVTEFVHTYKVLYENISKAQWGTIRSICSNDNNDFKTEIREYISSGKITWTVEQIETLFEKVKSRELMKQLAMQMPKVKKEK